MLGRAPVIGRSCLAVALSLTIAGGCTRSGRTPRNYVFAGEWAGSAEASGLCAPKGIAVSPNGDVYVANTGDDRVLYFTSGGSFRGAWGASGTGPGEFRRPTGIAVTSDGTVYVADSWNYRVQYFTPDGSLLGVWGNKGSGPGKFLLVEDVALNPDGDVYTVDSGSREVQRFTGTGSFLGRWGVERWDERKTRNELSVSVGPDGTVYVGAVNRAGVLRFSATGSFLDNVSSFGSGPDRWDAEGPVAFAPNGVACAFGENSFRTFDAAGSLLAVWRYPDARLDPYLGKFSGWAVGPDGTVYFADFVNSRVRYFAPIGSPYRPWPPTWAVVAVAAGAVGTLVGAGIFFGRRLRKMK